MVHSGAGALALRTGAASSSPSNPWPVDSTTRFTILDIRAYALSSAFLPSESITDSWSLLCSGQAGLLLLGTKDSETAVRSSSSFWFAAFTSSRIWRSWPPASQSLYNYSVFTPSSLRRDEWAGRRKKGWNRERTLQRSLSAACPSDALSSLRCPSSKPRPCDVKDINRQGCSCGHLVAAMMRKTALQPMTRHVNKPRLL